MVTLDSSVIVAFLDRKDAHHESFGRVVDEHLGNLIIPTPVIAEITYFIERDLSQSALVAFAQDIGEGAFTLDCCERDWDRIAGLIARYADFPLGLADAAVIACAERRGGLVVTLDHRHFGVVAREGTIQIAP